MENKLARSTQRLGLGATTAKLAAARARPARGRASGKMAQVRTFGANPGALEMFAHIPADMPQGAPLVVVLHGCGQTAAAFAADGGWLTLADRSGFAVIAPQQVATNNPNRCFNWFSTQDIARGDGEPASIAAMIDHAVRTHGLDPQRVFITGLSAGGAMAAVMLAAYPDLFAAGAIVAGLPFAAAEGVQHAFQAMMGGGGKTPDQLVAALRAAAPVGTPVPRLSIWHGDADHVVAVANAHRIAEQWAGAQGLEEAAPSTVSGPVARATWRAAGDDVARIELNLVSGLGHGVPLSTAGPTGLGTAAPFMLEAGVSSTAEIARFWGLSSGVATQTVTPNAKVEAKTKAPARPKPKMAKAAAKPQPEPAPSEPGVGNQVMSAISAHTPGRIQTIISDALRRAGLLK